MMIRDAFNAFVYILSIIVAVSFMMGGFLFGLHLAAELANALGGVAAKASGLRLALLSIGMLMGLVASYMLVLSFTNTKLFAKFLKGLDPI